MRTVSVNAFLTQVYITITIFAVLNVVTGVFCNLDALEFWTLAQESEVFCVHSGETKQDTSCHVFVTCLPVAFTCHHIEPGVTCQVTLPSRALAQTRTCSTVVFNMRLQKEQLLRGIQTFGDMIASICFIQTYPSNLWMFDWKTCVF